MVTIEKTEKYDYEVDEKIDTPKVFGDLITSDSIFAIKRSSTNAARVNDTTALVVKDKATDWIAAYPAKRKSAEEITAAERLQGYGNCETVVFGRCTRITRRVP